MQLLASIFSGNPPEDFIEKSTDKEIIISIPWNLKRIDVLTDAANIFHKLSGHFESDYGLGYKVNHSVGDRMAFHFPINSLKQPTQTATTQEYR